LIGVGGEATGGVRFYQKDPALHDRDIRVWLVTDDDGAGRREREGRRRNRLSMT
jgi:hypothetical protein